MKNTLLILFIFVIRNLYSQNLNQEKSIPYDSIHFDNDTFTCVMPLSHIELPEFQGGQDSLSKFLQKNYKVPQADIDSGLN